MKKNQKNSSKSSNKPKIVTNSKKSLGLRQLALWQRLALFLIVVLGISALGTFVYQRTQLNNLKAKAAAYQYPDKSITGDKRFKFAVCYRKTAIVNGVGYKEIIGIVSRPKGSFFWDGTTITAHNSAKQLEQTKTSNSWFTIGDIQMTYLSVYARTDGWAKLRYSSLENRGGVNNNVDANAEAPLTGVGYIPKC